MVQTPRRKVRFLIRFRGYRFFALLLALMGLILVSASVGDKTADRAVLALLLSVSCSRQWSQRVQRITCDGSRQRWLRRAASLSLPARIR
jgi:hypothetical protein